MSRASRGDGDATDGERAFAIDTDLAHPEIGVLVAMAYRAMAERHQQLMLKHGIESFRPAYGYIFRALYPNGSTLKDLAELAQISKQAVTQIVDGLEERGLAERRRSATSSRTKIVTLTDQGLEFLQVAIQCWREVEAELAELVGTSKTADVRHALESYVSVYGDWRSGERPRVKPVW